ncbi:MAG TPA: thiamine diphosphokinase [Spirochaetota bacterium]|nr:thiamine diphosphokinase [Spirochaetota bacterium]
MKNVSIVGNGTDYNKKKIIEALEKSEYIIAVDGGLNLLDKIKILPNLIVGDFDSVKKDILKRYKDIPTKIYPPEKDLTDSEIALRSALDLKPEKIFLLNSTGDYFDHALANVYNLVRNYDNNTEINIVTANSIIFLVRKEKNFKNLLGRRVSFFPIGESEVEMSGFKYKYDKNILKTEDYSVSNVIEANNAKIIVKYGQILCVLFDGGYK